MKVCAVIVTYADRFHLLKQVIESCFRENIEKVIVIDNDSDINSKNLLREYDHKENRLKVVYLDENTGSSGGYKRGLEEACSDDQCEFIWLLDDDNEPQKNSLKVLKEYWNNLEDATKKEKVALLSHRKDRQKYKKSMVANNPLILLGRNNSFMGLHIINIFINFFNILKLKFIINNKEIEREVKRSGNIPLAPYGGIFLHKKLIESIGYPNEKFFVYADDYDWSYRITQRGGNIILILDSKLKDLEKSWNLQRNNVSPFYRVLNEGSDFQAYYSTRNKIVFDKQRINNALIYRINKYLYRVILKVWSIKSMKNRYLLIIKAFDHAENNKLGRYEN